MPATMRTAVAAFPLDAGWHETAAQNTTVHARDVRATLRPR
jgi:hypothetical protein